MPQLMRLILNSGSIAFFPQEGFSFVRIEEMIRRLIDICVSFALLVPCVVFLPLIVIFIKSGSPGKVFYLQKRIGYKGKEFTIYKLRTMHEALCDDGEQQAVHRDERITKYGKWLRHYSIDELPQLYNVLKGNMSLVGPRPHAVPMDHYYSMYIPYYQRRYQVKPGITGLAQVRGSRGEIKTIQDMEQRILLDIKYIRKKSLWFDFLILLKTCGIIFKSAC